MGSPMKMPVVINFYYKQSSYDLSMLSSKFIPSQDNLECQCFEFTAPQQQWFLSRSTVGEPRHKNISLNDRSPSFQHSYVLGSFKRSLRREVKPSRTNPEAQLSETPGSPLYLIHSLQSDIQPSYQKPRKYKQIKNCSSMQLPWGSAEVAIKRHKIDNAQVFWKQYPSAPLNVVGSVPHSNNQNLRLPGRINFNYHTHVQHEGDRINHQLTYIPQHNSDFRPTLVKSSSAQQFQTAKAHFTQKQVTPIQKEQQTSDNFTLESSIPKQASFLQSSRPHQPSAIARQKKERRLSKVFYSCDLINEVPKKNSAQDSTKISTVKHKGSQEETTDKIKVDKKKNKGRLLLRRMSEIEQIKSLLDEEDSDQESVVLGRLEGYNRTELHLNEVPNLEKESYNQSISSTVMTIPNTRANERKPLYQSIF